MGAPFASVSDLESGWRPLVGDETDRAEVLLSRASVRIRQRFRSIDQRIESGDLDPDAPLMVAVAMVQRAMTVAANGVTQESQSSGPFSVSQTFGNPMGNLYMQADDIDLLTGSGKRRAFSLDLTPET